MEPDLKRLLDAEQQAEALIADARQRREHRIAEATRHAAEAEANLRDAVAALRVPILKEAERRAEQAVAQLTRQYEMRQQALRERAARHFDAAVAMAVKLLLDPAR